MKTVEYHKFKGHILDYYMSIDDLKEQLKVYDKIFEGTPFKGNIYHYGKQMVQDGFFDCYYQSAFGTLEFIYGDDFKRDVYLTKDGQFRWKNDEYYVWTVYKHKVALTIETMVKKGELVLE